MGRKKFKDYKKDKWFQGAGVRQGPNETYFDAPITGRPNTNIDFYNGDGTLHRRRKIGADGRACVDYDRGYPTRIKENERVDHAHTWSRTKGREDGRELYPKERREFDRAKRKRRIRR